MANGANAPPTIDITSNEDAIFVSSPNSFIPKANIVGNMIDMKKGTAMTEYTAIFPEVFNAITNNKIFIKAYKYNNVCGLINRIKNVPAMSLIKRK